MRFLITAVLMLFFVSTQAQSQQPPETVRALIDKYEVQNELCRDGYTDTPAHEKKMQAGCTSREVIGRELEKQGWCWGNNDPMAPEADYRWGRCDDFPSKEDMEAAATTIGDPPHVTTGNMYTNKPRNRYCGQVVSLLGYAIRSREAGDTPQIVLNSEYVQAMKSLPLHDRKVFINTAYFRSPFSGMSSMAFVASGAARPVADECLRYWQPQYQPLK